MGNCNKQCNCCQPKQADIASVKSNYVIVGNMNVGKSTLFSRLKGEDSAGVNIAGTTVSIRSGLIKSLDCKVFDTPGIHSIFSANEDERASRDILLSRKLTGDKGIILVADAKKLKRSIAIALQYAEYGLPMLFCVNMIDEAASRGIEIDFQKLSDELGVEIHTTIAREGIGVSELADKLSHIQPAKTMTYSDSIEQYLEMVKKLMQPNAEISRAIGLLLLSEDQGCKTYISDNFGCGMLDQLLSLAAQHRQESTVSMEIYLVNLYHKEAARIASSVQIIESPSKNPLIHRFGDWCTQLSTGIPIAMAVVTLMYFFVGSFGATYLVDSINGMFFEGLIIPWVTKIVEPIPSVFLRDMIIDPDFGVLPTGVFLALGLVLPVIFCFYIAFGILEDSGYLPRISILLDQIFQKMGLNGKGVIPLVMGFSCVTMAILTTRVLNTEKEKNIASFLLFLCMPCAPLIAVMLIILDKMPISATITVFGMIFLQILIAGYFANKILPGKRSLMVLEIPTMRVPKPLSVLKMSSLKTYFFMKEAVPVFVYASIAVFVFQRLGGLDLLEDSMGPFIGKIMGLPEKSIQVFIKTMIRRESGAVELEHLSNIYTNLQLVVNLLVMTFIAPCVNAIIVLYKERGGKAATAIMITVVVYAFIIGSVVNHTCLALGITFT